MAFFAITTGGLGANQNTGNSRSMQGLAQTVQNQQRIEQRGQLLEMQQAQAARDAEAFTVSQKIQGLRASSLEMNARFDAGTLREAEQTRQAQRQMALGRFDRAAGDSLSPSGEELARQTSRLAQEFPDAAGAIYTQGAQDLHDMQAEESNQRDLAYAEKAIRSLVPPPADGEQPNESAAKAQKGLAEMLQLAQETGDAAMTSKVLDSIFEVQHAMAAEQSEADMQNVSVMFMGSGLDNFLATRAIDGQVSDENWEKWQAANLVMNRARVGGYRDPRVAMSEFQEILTAQGGEFPSGGMRDVPQPAPAAPPPFLQDPAAVKRVSASVPAEARAAFAEALSTGQIPEGEGGKPSVEALGASLGLTLEQTAALTKLAIEDGRMGAALDARGALLDEEDASSAEASKGQASRKLNEDFRRQDKIF